jgi:pimeloyl-ACP methyl ester carboxylesterase
VTGPSRGRPSTSPPSIRRGWSELFVDAEDGTKLYVRHHEGAGELTNVLLDGIACDGFIWRYLQDDLLSVGNVLHWNYRGHGRSGAPADAERIGIDALVSDLASVRAACTEGPLLLLGHSMGCQLALEGYRHDPERVKGLVLICGAAGRITHTFKGSDVLAQALPALIARVQRHPHIARALWANFPPDVATRIALASGEVDAEAIRPEDLTAYSEHVANLDLLMFLRMLQRIGESSADDMLATIEVPVLVIAGTLDSFTPPHLAEQMAAAIPDSELMLVDNATHVVPIERRALVRQRIERFVNERLTAG